MLGKSKKGLNIAKDSWNVLKQDRELLIFPVLSFISCLAIIATIIAPAFFVSEYREWALTFIDDEMATTATSQSVEIGVLFLIYFVEYFVVVFFNSALVGCAMIRFGGGDPTISDGLKISFKRLPQIVAWALFAASIGTLLSVIESRSKSIGRWVVKFLGLAWAIGTYFVVPVIAVEGTGPITAVKRSLKLLSKTWGQGLVGNVAISILSGLVTIVVFALFFLGFFVASYFKSTPIAVANSICVLLFLIVVSIATSALKQIFLAGLYLYATENKVAPGFEEQVFIDAFKKK